MRSTNGLRAQNLSVCGPADTLRVHDSALLFVMFPGALILSLSGLLGTEQRVDELTQILRKEEEERHKRRLWKHIGIELWGRREGVNRLAGDMGQG